MKILRITLRNIASLSGLHTVDFTREPLRSAGLFSISGPTGSGKSTLLDGLCLALYDETPRLHRVGRLAQSTNGESQADTRNLLRRGAGSGMAEVAFVGIDGLHWTARWEVRRSRGLSDGSLQKVQMTLFRGHIPPAGVGTIEAGGTKTDVLEAIKNKIGLSFLQFTRAVLLAQNDFATFLRANDKERAEILQALTGTEQYEAISIRVFQRCQLESQAVTTAQQLLNASPSLSPNSRTDVEEACKKAASDVEQFETKLNERRSHADWLSKLATLEDQCLVAEKQQRGADAQFEAAAARRLDLKLTEILGRHAQPLRSAEHQANASVFQAEAALVDALKANERCETARNDASTTYDQAKVLLDSQQDAAIELRKQVNSARALDAQLVPLIQQCEQSRVAFASAEQDYESTNSRLKTKRDEQVSCVEQVQAIQRSRSQHIVYEPFVADTAFWTGRLNQAIASESELAVQQEQKNTSQVLQEKAEADSQSGRNELAQQQSVCIKAENSWESAQLAAHQFDLEQLDRERTQCTDNQHNLHRFKAQLVEFYALNESVADGVAECNLLKDAQAADEDHCRSILQSELPNANLALTASQQQLQHIKDTLDDHAIRFRHELRSGESCPVCGATEHPYATLPPDLELVALQAAQTHVTEKQRQSDELKTASDRLQAACEQRAKQLTQRSNELQRVKQRLAEHQFESAEQPVIAAMVSLPLDQQLFATEAKIKETAKLSKDIVIRIKQQRDATTHLEVCRRIRDEQREHLQHLELRQACLEKERGLCEQRTEHTAKQVQRAEQQQSAAHQELREIWLGWPTARDEYNRSPELFLKSFREGTIACNQLKLEMDQLHVQLQATEAELTGLQEHVSVAQRAKEMRAQELQTAIESCDQTRTQRMKLLDGRSVVIVEIELDRKNEQAKKSLEKAQATWSEADKQLALADKQLQDCHTQALSTRMESTQASLLMANWLAEFCQTHVCTLTFEELDERLSRDQHWLEAENTALDRLENDARTAEGACQAHRQNLQAHLSQRLTTDSADAVSFEIDLLQKSCEDARKCSEQARAELKRDDDLLQLNSARLLELRRLEQQAQPWQQLNELIGSSNGDKFRMIAQRRTLDLLLGFSNQQLRQLAPRYRLERLQESLNLIVVDCDMGDERRSIHSLSGGESFLVSLALALGLASLTSDRVRVESLFIDEGFGSLDADSLNTAMGALMQLESQGRKVGVISHVQEMTDVIPVQIKVQKGQGGASRIVIPGNSTESDCYQLHAIDGNIDNPNADVVECSQVTLCGNNSVAHHTGSNLLNNI